MALFERNIPDLKSLAVQATPKHLSPSQGSVSPFFCISSYFLLSVDLLRFTINFLCLFRLATAEDWHHLKPSVPFTLRPSLGSAFCAPQNRQARVPTPPIADEGTPLSAEEPPQPPVDCVPEGGDHPLVEEKTVEEQ